MQIWKNYITKGNDRFSAQDYETASILYKEAIKQAEKLFHNWKEPAEGVSALIVSHHNLSDLYQMSGRMDLARQYLNRAHQILLKAVISTPINDRRHIAVFRGSIETYSQLIEHKRCFPDL